MHPTHWLARLLPGRCILCADHSEHLLCAACQGDLPLNTLACPRCALPLAAEGLCPSCQAEAPPVHKCVAAYLYQAPLAGLINQWKHKGRRQLLGCLAPALLNQLRTAYLHDSWPQVLLPVPLHWHKRLQRGFNQTEQLAQRLGRTLQIPTAYQHLGRHRGHSQQGLDRQARLANLHRQFYLRAPAPFDHLAVVDDVMTTGATGATLAKLLQDHGVKRVDVWLLARTP